MLYEQLLPAYGGGITRHSARAPYHSGTVVIALGDDAIAALCRLRGMIHTQLSDCTGIVLAAPNAGELRQNYRGYERLTEEERTLGAEDACIRGAIIAKGSPTVYILTDGVQLPPMQPLFDRHGWHGTPTWLSFGPAHADADRCLTIDSPEAAAQLLFCQLVAPQEVPPRARMRLRCAALPLRLMDTWLAGQFFMDFFKAEAHTNLPDGEAARLLHQFGLDLGSIVQTIGKATPPMKIDLRAYMICRTLVFNKSGLLAAVEKDSGEHLGQSIEAWFHAAWALICPADQPKFSQTAFGQLADHLWALLRKPGYGPHYCCRLASDCIAQTRQALEDAARQEEQALNAWLNTSDAIRQKNRFLARPSGHRARAFRDATVQSEEARSRWDMFHYVKSVLTDMLEQLTNAQTHFQRLCRVWDDLNQTFEEAHSQILWLTQNRSQDWLLPWRELQPMLSRAAQQPDHAAFAERFIDAMDVWQQDDPVAICGLVDRLMQDILAPHTEAFIQAAAPALLNRRADLLMADTRSAEPALQEQRLLLLPEALDCTVTTDASVRRIALPEPRIIAIRFTF